MIQKSFYTPQFAYLCLSSFLFFASINMIIPELPAFIEQMEGGQYKGLIIFLFTVSAGISRPYSGKLADSIGRLPVMIIGALVSSVIALLYPVVLSLIGFFVLRFLHGFSTGFKPTGTSAYVADIVPANRRGEAIGFLGFFGSLGMATGPFFGSLIANQFSLSSMFVVSAATAALSVIILFGMKETVKFHKVVPFSLVSFSGINLVFFV